MGLIEVLGIFVLLTVFLVWFDTYYFMVYPPCVDTAMMLICTIAIWGPMAYALGQLAIYIWSKI